MICHVPLQDTRSRDLLTLRKRATHCNHTARFGDRSHSGSGDITCLIRQVTLQDHVIKGCFEFMEGSISLYVTTVSGLMARGIVTVEIKYLCVALRDHVFKRLFKQPFLSFAITPCQV